MLLLSSGALLHQRYRVEGPLERGGSVEIYLARDEQSGQLVDLQLLSPATTATAVQRHTVAEELARLQHPALPVPLETFHMGNRPVVVSEHVPGTSLEELRLRQPGRRLPPRAALLALLPILDALQLLHSHTPPLPHGAISPATILIGPDGQPRLSGLAATELWTDGAGQSADLYAVGATLYTLLTGAPPSAGATPGEPLLPPSRLVPEITPALEQALMRLLAGERASRPENPADAAQELSAALDPQLCTRCGYANRGTAKFCTGCGATLPMTNPSAALLTALLMPTTATSGSQAATPPQALTPQAMINELPTTPLMLARTDQMAPARGAVPPQPIPIPPPAGASPARPQNGARPGARRLGLPLLLMGGLLLLLAICVGAGTLLLFRDRGSDPPAQWAMGMTAAAAAATPESEPQLTGQAGAAVPSAEPTIDGEATSAAAAAAQTTEAAAVQTPAAATAAAVEAALLGQTATALAATALVPPTATVAPEPPKLRFTLGPTDGRADCVAVVIRGVNTQGWQFRINGLRLDPGAFNGGEYAVACNLGAGREVTINVYDANGNIVPGGEGVPTRGGSTMIADWR